MNSEVPDEHTAPFRATVIGWFLIYLGATVLIGGIAVGYLDQLGVQVQNANTPTAEVDAATPANEIAQSFSPWIFATGAMVLSGLGLIAFGSYRVVRPIEVASLRKDERS